jgi:hypothetical protein
LSVRHKYNNGREAAIPVVWHGGETNSIKYFVKLFLIMEVGILFFLASLLKIHGV